MSQANYSSDIFGSIQRVWFGLTVKHGGSGAVLTFNETESTKVTRFYPRGPVEILKFGVYTEATLGKGEEDFVLSIGGTRVTAVTASTTSAPYTIASVDVATAIDAGGYLTILSSTNVCSTGSVACFIDFRPRYEAGKWDT